ncbi:glycerol-3-phosphate dehydrogenase C-terminal domain-containing protein, partial [Actinomyces sp. MRS3W]|uniref:glycerol-3-phosphate dehydrogenase C-terminal domain-containing protein n=1 Tax=Actinomyces sp. MRS3W TaxID=2800796 RepID=UPI0028FCFD49
VPGAAGYHELTRRAGDIARERGWTLARVTHLLDRYGDELPALLEAIDAHDAASDDEPAWGEPLPGTPAFLRAEVAWAVTHEGATHLEDVLVRRVRLDLECRDRGLGAADEVLEVMAPLLGWSADDVAAERAAYAQRVEQIAAAEAETTDATAVTHVTRPI